MPSIAGVAQLVERNLAKVEVESSRLFSRSKLKTGSLGFPFLSEGTVVIAHVITICAHCKVGLLAR